MSPRRTGYLLLVGALLAAGPLRAQILERTDPQKEIEIGRQVAREVEKQLPLSKDAAANARVRRIGQALIDAMPQRAYPYQFRVLAVPEFNAFCLPGGFMYVFEGLLARLPNDDAVAFVMAHEITHAAHRHWASQMRKMEGVQVGAIVGTVLLGDSQIPSMLQTLVSLQYSRENEDDADRTGVRMMWRAGYDTEGGIQAAEVMAKLEGGRGGPDYLRDHPPARDRLKRLKAEAAELARQPRPASPGPAAPDLDLAAVLGRLPTVAAVANPWFPLAVGAEWRYEVAGGDATSAYTVRILSGIAAAGGTIYRGETLLAKDLRVPFQTLTTADRVWRRNRPTDVASPWREQHALKEAPAGAPVPAAVTTPCGTFREILHVQESAGGSTYDLWFARGVGLVLRKCRETGVTETLHSYRLPQPK